MDPTANVAEQLRITERLIKQIDSGLRPDEDDTNRLCELVTSLNDWLSRGGFLPDQWKR